MKNKMVDLNNHLFAQIERLGDEDLNENELEKEIKRTSSIVAVSEQIIKNASIALKAAEIVATHGKGDYEKMLPAIDQKQPPQIESKNHGEGY